MWNTNIFSFKYNSTQEVFLETNLSNGKKNVCIPRSFLVINICNKGNILCSLCILSLSCKDKGKKICPASFRDTYQWLKLS